MVANFNLITNSTALLSTVNNSVGGWFWFGVMIMIFAVLVLAEIGWGFTVAVLGTSFLMLMVSMFMFYAGLISWSQVLFFIAIMLGTVIYTYVVSKQIG